MKLAPVPPITPRVNIRIGTFGLKGDIQSPMLSIMLPDKAIGLKPNLFTKAPTIGPNKHLIPKKTEPTQDTVTESEE